MLALSLALAFAAVAPANARTYKVLRSFRGASDGQAPDAGLVLDAVGNLYGTTNAGGAHGYGTVFKLSPTGRETVLYSFMGGADGANPWASLILDKTGNLYGTTYGGGAYGYGTVFEVATTGTEQLLYNFMSGTDGANPYAGLIWDPTGNLYGTTSAGGSNADCNGCGTVFKLTPGSNGWTETVLYSFNGSAGGDGAQPWGGLLREASGNLYGTTNGNGGTVFELSNTGTETVLCGFSYDAPYFVTLVRDKAGHLYGTTEGAFGSQCVPWGDECGSVFELQGTTETILWEFSATEYGDPYAGVIRGSKGALYGTTYYGGVYGWGSVFELRAGTMTVLHSFAWHGKDGVFPTAPLVEDKAGNFYGTTSEGGAYGYGIVFKLSR
jgi:uncharacterized repeat protein (TIGR03803 family)